MKTLFIVDAAASQNDGGAQIVAAEDYLAEHAHAHGRYDAVINLCSLERYQGKGFYVSLVADARGHNPVPTTRTLEDLQSATLPELLAAGLEATLAQALQAETAQQVELYVYFGRDPAGRYPAIAQRLFQLVQAPLLRATLKRGASGWRLDCLRALNLADLPGDTLESVCIAVVEHFAQSGQVRAAPRNRERPAIALLYEGKLPDSPSNPAAVDKFVATARLLGIDLSIVDRAVADRLEDFDGLLLRETTHLNHWTYDLARRASALGMAVIDDPDSILRCNNKVFLHELLTRHGVPMPKSITVHRRNVDQVSAVVGLPCVLKLPDGAFSLGVSKVETDQELREAVDELLEKSELLIAQSFVPTAFDWRVGMLDGRPLFVCRYFMAPNHWQVIKRDTGGRTEGKTAAISIGEAPASVISTATRAANLIGAGFYGVDLKENESGCFVMEVNDNPNVDAGNEDGVLGDALYREILAVMKRRIGENALRVPLPQPAPT